MRNIMIRAAVANVVVDCIVNRLVVAVAEFAHALGHQMSLRQCGPLQLGYLLLRPDGGPEACRRQATAEGDLPRDSVSWPGSPEFSSSSWSGSKRR